MRAAYTRGVAGFIDALTPFTESDADRAERITTVRTLVGAPTLSRATSGSALSDEILAAAHDHLTPDRSTSD